MEPKVSIVIPVYNAVSTVEKALNSVLAQDYLNLEIIVVDGLSNDGTLKILNKYKDKIYSLISETDSGVYHAMNKGIEKASGEFFYFLGADDFLSSETVLSNVFKRVSADCQLIFGDVVNFGAKNKRVKQVHTSTFGKSLIWKNTLHHQSAFYHRSIFTEFRYDQELKILSDYELNLILLNKDIKTTKVDEIVAYCSAVGISKEFNVNLYKEELKIKKRQLSMLSFLAQIPWVLLKFIYKNTTG